MMIVHNHEWGHPLHDAETLWEGYATASMMAASDGFKGWSCVHVVGHSAGAGR